MFVFTYTRQELLKRKISCQKTRAKNCVKNICDFVLEQWLRFDPPPVTFGNTGNMAPGHTRTFQNPANTKGFEIQQGQVKKK